MIRLARWSGNSVAFNQDDYKLMFTDYKAGFYQPLVFTRNSINSVKCQKPIRRGQSLSWHWNIFSNLEGLFLWYLYPCMWLWKCYPLLMFVKMLLKVFLSSSFECENGFNQSSKKIQDVRDSKFRLKMSKFFNFLHCIKFSSKRV